MITATTPYTPPELAKEFVGRTIKGIRKRLVNKHTHVDLFFTDGSKYRISCVGENRFLGAFVNIMDTAKPITEVRREYSVFEDKFALRFFAGDYELCSIRTTNLGTGWPVTVQIQED